MTGRQKWQLAITAMFFVLAIFQIALTIIWGRDWGHLALGFLFLLTAAVNARRFFRERVNASN
jgi:hypothetical protein